MSSQKLSQKSMAIAALATLTALIHLWIGFTLPAPLFLANGFGFIGLMVAYLFLPQFKAMRGQLRWAFIGYTLLTIVLYFVMNSTSDYNALGLGTKAIEAALAYMLFSDS